MRRLLKIVLYLVILVVALAGAAVAAFLYAPKDTVVGFAAERVREATGRTLVVEGALDRTFYPVLGVTAEKVRLSNPDWAEADDLVTIERAQVGVRLTDLISGRVVVEIVELVEPVVALEISEDGAESWAFETSGGDGPDGPGGGGGGGGDDGAADLVIEKFAVAGGRLTLTDRRPGGAEPVTIEAITFDGALPAIDAPLTLTGSATAQGRPVKLDLKVDSLAAINAGEAANAVATLESDGVRASFGGDFEAPKGDAPPVAKGDFLVALSDNIEESGWIRAFFPPALAPLGAVDLAGEFDVGAEGLDVSVKGDVVFNNENTAITGSAKAGPGWAGGAEPATVLAVIENRLVSARYEGVAGAAPAGAPIADGAYAVKTASVTDLAAWAAPGVPLQGPVAKLGAVDLEGALGVKPDGLATTAKGVIGYNARTIALDLSLSGGSDWESGGPIATKLVAGSDGLFDASWDGEVRAGGPDGAAKGALSFSSEALRAFTAWLEAPIEAPDGEFETASFAAAVDAAFSSGGSKGSLKDLAIELDDKRVSGEISFDGTGRPRLEADIKTSALDLRPFTGGGGGAGGGASPGAGGGGGGWSEEPLDVAALNLLDARIAIETEGLATNVVRIGPARVNATLEEGKLTVSAPEMALYGGSAVTEVVIDGRSTPSFALNLDAAGVALRPLLADAAKTDWLEGAGAAKADIKGQGVSMKALMKSLEGSASINFTDGAIIGVNLAAIVRNVTSLGTASSDTQKTDFAELSGSFAISGGVARNDDFVMSGPLVRLTGSGVIDIGEQSLNYRAVPKAVATLKGQGGDRNLRGVAFPILISGPWANPSIRPDLAGGAIESVTGILTDGEGAGSFLNDLKGEGVGGVLDNVLGGGDAEGEGGGAGGVLDSVLGGGAEGEGGDGGGAGGVLEGVLGGGDDKDDSGPSLPIPGGLFGD